jgi:hypothetical protein
VIYIIGSLKHVRVHKVALDLREAGFEVFDDWHATAPDADRFWTAYERDHRGHNLRDALRGKAAQNQFQFDFKHLAACKGAVMVMPAGKSAHLELGFVRGLGKPGFILFDQDPEEFDLMYAFATDVCYGVEELVAAMTKAGL